MVRSYRFASILLLGLPLSAAAAPPPPPKKAAEGRLPSAVADLLQCRAELEDEARLACFNRQLTILEQAIGKSEIVILDKRAVKETRRSLFGFSLPRLPFLEMRGKEEGSEENEVSDQIDATIASVRSLGYGKWEIVLEDGARWSTTEAFRGAEPRAGRTITIRRAALGSYMGKIGSARSVRMKRVE